MGFNIVLVHTDIMVIIVIILTRGVTGDIFQKKATSVRMVTTMQEKRSHIKGCVLFAFQISSDKGKEVENANLLSRDPVL